jgi:hypothetical protein
MDINEIKKSALAALRSIFNLSAVWSKAKQALKLPYAKTYIVLAAIFTLLFWIATFPYEVILRNTLKDLEKNVFRQIYISEMSTGLFDVTAMNNVYIVLQSGSEITIRSADIDISVPKLIFSKDIKGSFQFNGLKYAAESVQVDLNLNGDVFLDYKTFNDIPQSGNFKILVNNAYVKIGEINLPDSMGGLPLALPLIKIKSGNLEGTIGNQKITITNIKIFGDLSCTINGSIAMAKTLAGSRLDLKATADADSEVLKNYHDLLKKFTNDRNQVVLAIRGSLSNPYIDFSQTGQRQGPQSGSEDPLIKKNQPIDSILPTY